MEVSKRNEILKYCDSQLRNWVLGKKGELEKQIDDNEEEIRVLKKTHNELFMGK